MGQHEGRSSGRQATQVLKLDCYEGAQFMCKNDLIRLFGKKNLLGHVHDYLSRSHLFLE